VTRCTFHNLQETGAFYLRLLCCSESILYWKEGRKTSAWMKVPIAQSHLIPVAFDHGFIYHHAVSDYAMLLKWLPQFEESKVPPFATHQVGAAGITFTLSYFFKAIKSTGAIGSSKFGTPVHKCLKQLRSQAYITQLGDLNGAGSPLTVDGQKNICCTFLTVGV